MTDTLRQEAEQLFKEFWKGLTRKGDPARIPNPVRTGFNAGYEAGRNAESAEPERCPSCGSNDKKFMGHACSDEMLPREMWSPDLWHTSPAPSKPSQALPGELEAVGHCLSYLEGMLLRQPENSCESIQNSLSIAFYAYKRAVFNPERRSSVEQAPSEPLPDVLHAIRQSFICRKDLQDYDEFVGKYKHALECVDDHCEQCCAYRSYYRQLARRAYGEQGATGSITITGEQRTELVSLLGCAHGYMRQNQPDYAARIQKASEILIGSLARSQPGSEGSK